MPSATVTVHQPKRAVEAVVILIHGLTRSARSLGRLRKELVQQGFGVVSLDYPSRTAGITQLAADGLPKALEAAYNLGDHPMIHFVTHSMGAILLRAHLEQHPDLKIGNTVMIAPPNQGSEVVDKLRWVPGFRFVNGPAGFELGTDQDSVPRSLGPVTGNVGVIAGVRTVNPLLSLLLPKPNDGKVSLESTKVEGMADFWVAQASHTLIVDNAEVIEQTLTFLQQGQFRTAEQKRAITTPQPLRK